MRSSAASRFGFDSKLGVIPHDLRQEETIVQIAEALDSLNSAVASIFSCIDERLSENTKRLAGIKGRAVKLQGRLDHLQNNLSLKAVKLYSAAKYPSNHVYREYPLTLKLPIKKEDKPPSVYKSPVPIAQELNSQNIVTEKSKDGRWNVDINIQDKLQFYHVKSKTNKGKGSGHSRAIPVRPTSVSSLLLHDAKDNQYGKLPAKSLASANDKREIEDAPTSILQSWHTNDLESPSNYFYAPTLGEVPQINVPLSLPDLPGIVDDERFVLDLHSQSPIAPSSVVTTPTVNLPLPAAPSDSAPDATMEPQNSRENEPSLPNLSLPSISSEQNPPPPPPPVEIGNVSHPGPPPPPPPNPSTLSISTSQPPPSAPAPPPPPPPPSLVEPPKLSSSVTKDTKTQSVKSVPNVDQVDNRSSLMAAIRDAGGVGRAKLRSAARKDENTDKWSSAFVGGDLMADLHNKLSLRRRGISGTATGALGRMSAMIPPPPKPNESATSERNSAASEQDSQPDTDDWEE
ncbi:WASH complex subunit 1 isoform X1 [Neodiprion pinetum]|uniref:WASH complex subunit 1 isoform X1 n=1 Tax=Neodiprion pinetum TaxID=441929 RepID=UPI001EDEDF34|nr:WASH complex subunit 1-like isoform X1 [Neodiprion pinetum]